MSVALSNVLSTQSEHEMNAPVVAGSAGVSPAMSAQRENGELLPFNVEGKRIPLSMLSQAMQAGHLRSQR